MHLQCYMNSVCQTLLALPEFKVICYWKKRQIFYSQDDRFSTEKRQICTDNDGFPAKNDGLKMMFKARYADQSQAIYDATDGQFYTEMMFLQ